MDGAADVLWSKGQGKGGQLLTILVIPIARTKWWLAADFSGHPPAVPTEAPQTMPQPRTIALHSLLAASIDAAQVLAWRVP